MCYQWCLWRPRKIIARTVKKLKGYKLIKTVTKSSGSGWTRKVIVTNKDANAAKKKKWWKKKQENYKPFKWKVRAMKLEVREFRSGYVRCRGKWFVSKNGKIVKPNKKAGQNWRRNWRRSFPGCSGKLKGTSEKGSFEN